MSEALFQVPPTDLSRVLILAILYEHPVHGYVILEELERRLGKKVSPGLLYPFLRLLERRGLARHRNVRIGRKLKKIYELTPQGKKQSSATFGQLKTIVSKAIAQAMEKCSGCGCRIFDRGFEKTVGGARAIFCCAHCARASQRTLRTSEDQ